MRTATAPELAAIAALTRQVPVRFKIQNGSGTMIDYTTWLESIKPDEDIDRPVAGLTFELRRDDGITKSFSPFRSDSTLNRLDDGVTYSPAIDLHRIVTFEAGTIPIGAVPVAGDYKLLYKGTIDIVNFEKSPITITCRDLGAPLVDLFVETETFYGSGPGRAIELVKQDILDTYLGVGVVPVYTPVSPGFNIISYQQQKMSVSDAEQALDQLIGWDSRYWWDDGTSAFRYTFQRPPRTKTTPDYTFGPSAYYDVTALDLDLTDIRNVVQVSYRDGTTKARTSATRTDATSITKYGRRFFLIQESDTSPINSLTEAQDLADAVLADLKEPKATLEIELPFFWPCQLWDLYRFSANGKHFNSDQDLAVASYRHELSRGKHRTFVKLRGKPAGGYGIWLQRGGTIGGGTAIPPEPQIIWLNTETDDSVWKFRFDAIPGTGGGGTNLSYIITSKRGAAAESTLSSGSGTAFPVFLNVTRDAQLDKVVRFAVTDAATGLVGEDRITIPSIRDEVTTTGAPKRGKPWDDSDYAVRGTTATGDTAHSGVKESGGKTINRLFAKPLLSSPDSQDSVLTGLVNRELPLTVLTSNNDLNARKVVGTGSTPSAAAGAGLGTGGSVGVTISGTDTAGKINFTQGASGFGTGEKAVITFAAVYATAPFVLLTHDNSASTTVYAFGPTSITTTGFAISSPIVGLAGDQHAFWYHVLA